MRVTVINERDQFPIEIELNGDVKKFTKNAAIELYKKLEFALYDLGIEISEL